MLRDILDLKKISYSTDNAHSTYHNINIIACRKLRELFIILNMYIYFFFFEKSSFSNLLLFYFFMSIHKSFIKKECSKHYI